MNDVMVDLETMGTGPNAAIIAIGAVEFDLAQGNVGDRFYAVVSLESSVANGGIMDPSTVMWWLGQSNDARKAVRADGEHINVALLRFATWLGQCAPRDNLRLWGNGAGFDNVVLEEAYRRSQLTCPWHFWNNRCYRTMKGLQPEVKAVRIGTHHNALDDALTQARHLIAIMQPRPTAVMAVGLSADEWAPHLKEEETPFQRLEREIKDSDTLAGLLAAEKRKTLELQRVYDERGLQIGRLDTALERAQPAAMGAGSLPAIDQATVDKHLDAVLRASGSALRHYSMQKSLDDMRAAMLAAMAQPTASSAAGHCCEGDRCVCGGDLPRIREGCSNWVKGGA